LVSSIDEISRMLTPSSDEPRAARVRNPDASALFGRSDALYERHLVFDGVVDRAEVAPRDRFVALAHSIRDLLSRRWIETEDTYTRWNVKRVYYLSMEFLIGRSLANNVVNLLLEPIVKEGMSATGVHWCDLLEEEADAGLGNGGLGRLAVCLLDSA